LVALISFRPFLDCSKVAPKDLLELPTTPLF
jgi:hypothetical protein